MHNAKTRVDGNAIDNVVVFKEQRFDAGKGTKCDKEGASNVNDRGFVPGDMVLIVMAVLIMVVTAALPMPARSSQEELGCDAAVDGSCCACGRDVWEGYYCHPGAIYGIASCFANDRPGRVCPRNRCNLLSFE